MGIFFTVLVLVLVLGVLAAMGFTLFEMSPFGRHTDHYRDPGTGRRRWSSPNLEGRN